METWRSLRILLNLPIRILLLHGSGVVWHTALPKKHKKRGINPSEDSKKIKPENSIVLSEKSIGLTNFLHGDFANE